MDRKIKVAVFPVAGLGTRFLPATKVVPKEMFPVVDKPLIQYAVEEAKAAGVEHMIFVTSSKKKVLEDHFDAQFELMTHLKEKGKESFVEGIESIISSGITFSYIRQSKALGLGHAILLAEPLVQQQSFAVLLADDLVTGNPPCLKAMVDYYAENSNCDGLISTQIVADDQVSQYGVVESDAEGCLSSVVEKPDPSETESRQAIVGRYIMPPSIFSHLRCLKVGAGGEMQLTDALANDLNEKTYHSFDLSGMERYDCGSRLGFLEANLRVALSRDDIRPSAEALLKRIVSEMDH